MYVMYERFVWLVEVGLIITAYKSTRLVVKVLEAFFVFTCLLHSSKHEEKNIAKICPKFFHFYPSIYGIKIFKRKIVITVHT